MTTLHITGVFPPMVTPFKENGDVDYDAFVRNIERWNEDTLGGYVVLGSNSETAFLSYEEKLKLIELTVQAARQDRLVVAGTGVESLRETIRLTNEAARLGVQAALVLTPHYYGDAMTDEALIRFFSDVAEKSDIPILIYNVPKFTHVNVSVNVVRVLSQHPNIIGMKDSKGDVAQLEMFKKNVAERFNLIVGTASAWLSALQLGIRAGIHALANCAPNQCSEVQRLFDTGELDKAQELQQRIVPVNTAVTATYGVAGLKYATTLMGYEGGFVRRPLLPLDDSAKNNLRTILSTAGFLSND
ncbi:MAG TPA: dihydrodipicolinate synthase family protein [Bacteroidota bacterium]|nr:dihydrodipicolinate synthase family protein [Bacteroidota bacterium]